MALAGMNNNRKQSSVVDNRDKYIGGSDLPKAKTLNSAISLMKEKLSSKNKEFKSIYTEFGNIAEPLIFEYLSMSLYGGDGDFLPSQYKIIEREEGKLGFRANCDIQDRRAKAIIEIKTVDENVFGSKDFEKKLYDYKLQCAFYQGVFGYNRGMIAVMPRPSWLIDKSFSEWTVGEMEERRTEIEEFIVKELYDKIKKFDADTTRELSDEIIKRVEYIDLACEKVKATQSEDSITDTEKIVAEYADLEKQISAIKERQAELMSALSDISEATAWSVGDNVITYTPARTITRKSFDSRAFSKEHADMYNAYVRETSVNYKPSIKIK